MRTVGSITGWVTLCMVAGAVASHFQVQSLAQWYPHLHKSPLTPPGWVFPLAWTVLYLCMGVSIALVRLRGPANKLTMLFLAGLALNFVWSFLFFYWQNPLWGLIDIVALWLLLVWYAVTAWPRHRVAVLLFVPYIAWVAFAAYLNWYIAAYNHMPA